MQLGDWVEFDTVVIKEQTPNGSRSVTMTLGHTRTGTIIGERYVYDVVAGTPPALSNRQTVLLVAVSMHRNYRVFPGDARQTVPPATTAIVPATGVTIKLAQGTAVMHTGKRTIIAQADLDVLVANAISQYVAASAIFTAYDITLHVRDANPGVDVPHNAVRETVHTHMKPFMKSDLYENETATFGGASAMRYVPV